MSNYPSPDGTLAPPQTIITDPLLSTQELAKLASLKCRTLERYRLLGKGPKFLRIGGERLVRYRCSDVDIWLRQAA
jgi:predicted DNA-binding transcriptional regulator AlpA